MDKVVLAGAPGLWQLRAGRRGLIARLRDGRSAPVGAEGAAKEPGAIQAAKAATAKAELEHLHAEANYRVAHAKLMEVIGAF